MGERTQVTQVCQLGVEATPGTAVATTKQLPSCSVTTGIDGDTVEITQAGLKFPTGFAPGKDWSTAKFMAAPPSYDEMIYIFASAMSYAVGVVQGATTAYKWTSAISSSLEDVIKTYTLENGSAVRAHKFPYGLFTDFNIKGDRSKIEMSANMIGQQTTDGITLTVANTAVNQVPLLPKEIDVYMDTASAGLGVTKLSRLLKWELDFKSRFGPMWTVNSTVPSWAAAVELPIDATFKVMVEADTQGMSILPFLRAGTKQFLELKCTSAQLAGTAIPYSFKTDMCGIVQGPPKEFSNADGVYAVEWTFGIVHDATWAKAMTIETVCKSVTL